MKYVDGIVEEYNVILTKDKQNIIEGKHVGKAETENCVAFAEEAKLKGDKEEAFKWYRKVADAGDADAMLQIGSYYGYGSCGLKEDSAEARKWYKLVENRGNRCVSAKIKELESHGGVFMKCINRIGKMLRG